MAETFSASEVTEWWACLLNVFRGKILPPSNYWSVFWIEKLFMPFGKLQCMPILDWKTLHAYCLMFERENPSTEADLFDNHIEKIML